MSINSILCGQESDNCSLSGKIADYDKSNDYIYLLKISSPLDFFNSKVSLLYDSIKIEENGSYYYDKYCQLDSNFVYKLNYVRKGDAPTSVIRNYVSNNYVFFIKEHTSLKIDFSMPQITRSYKIWSNGRNKLIRDLLNHEDSLYLLSSLYFSDQSESNKNNYINYAVNKLMPLGKAYANNANDLKLFSFFSNYAELNFNDVNNFDFVNNKLNQSFISESNSPYFKAWEKILLNSMFPGSKIPDFTLLNKDKVPFALSEAKGKLILIDFWASWCGPCRKENKETVVPLYEKYNNKGFQVISISEDTNEKLWLNAITKDNLTWINLIDLKGEGSISKLYKVESLPTTFLVDNNHNLLFKNLRGEELIKFVDDYYDKLEKE